jgi:hypothetical protein
LINTHHYTGSELQHITKEDVAQFIRIGTSKGFRHIKKLPVRGQRTLTNANTFKKNSRCNPQGPNPSAAAKVVKDLREGGSPPLPILLRPPHTLEKLIDILQGASCP